MYSMQKNLITITEAAAMLGLTVTTLRRWDHSGKLVATRAGKGTHRLYQREDIEKLATDIFSLAKSWVGSDIPREPQDIFYCPNSSVFQSRLHRMESELIKTPHLGEIFSLISSITGEIGNNSFDHNIGSWHDIPGIFFAYDLSKKMVVLADRGQGIFQTLKRVRPHMQNHEEALRVAFTEIVTGRAPEHRGNGLKYVRRVIITSPIQLIFQTGNAKLTIQEGDVDLTIEENNISLNGCIALMRF